MFVSVILDPGSADSAKALASVLVQHSFKRIQHGCWENSRMNEKDLPQLKKDLDSVTDFYDTLRLYQFPVNNCFAITELQEKKWKKCLLRG